MYDIYPNMVFKEGEIVVAKDSFKVNPFGNDDLETGFTKGEYCIVEQHPDFYWIYPKGVIKYYGAPFEIGEAEKYFMSLREYRKMKLKNICEKS